MLELLRESRDGLGSSNSQDTLFITVKSKRALNGYSSHSTSWSRDSRLFDILSEGWRVMLKKQQIAVHRTRCHGCSANAQHYQT